MKHQTEITIGLRGEGYLHKWTKTQQIMIFFDSIKWKEEDQVWYMYKAGYLIASQRGKTFWHVIDKAI